MKLLASQEYFEHLIHRAPPDAAPLTEPLPAFAIIYFTATWCGACKALNPDAIEAAVPQASWLKCDIDENDYTAGYCGIRSIPTFLAIIDGKIVGKLTSNNNDKVIAWAKEFASLA